MFDLEKFKTGEYYVHLPTKEIYDNVMEYLDENGFKWSSCVSLLGFDRWRKFREKMCIRVDSPFKGLLFDDLDYYKENGYKQLEINKLER